MVRGSTDYVDASRKRDNYNVDVAVVLPKYMSVLHVTCWLGERQKGWRSEASREAEEDRGQEGDLTVCMTVCRLIVD